MRMYFELKKFELLIAPEGIEIIVGNAVGEALETLNRTRRN